MSYKSAIGASAPEANNKYRTQARQLQELFPKWSNDDLQSLLAEVGGDVEVAAARLSEGHVEQWAVSGKKDKALKKPHANTSSHASKDSLSFPGTRGDFRGGRGGVRGGRGGSTRGGVAPRSRGGVRGSTPVNGHAHSPSLSGAGTPNAWAESTTSSAEGVPSTSNWAESTEAPTNSVTPSTWGASSTNTTWAAESDSASPAVSVAAPAPALIPVVPKVSKTPATSKMSWAQIARPQEKPAPSPLIPTAIPIPATTMPPSPPSVPPPAELEPQPAGWEEPTTVQSPSWEEEAPIIKPSTSAADVWGATTEPPVEPIAEPVVEVQPEESIPEPAAPAAVPSPVPSPAIKSLRPAPSSHRNSARYRAIDQAVVMPSSFGSGVEKVGMQFGSLSLGGDAPDSESAPEPALGQTPSTPPSHIEPPVAAPANTLTSAASTSLGSSLFQPSAPPPQAAPQHNLPPSVSQPVMSQPSKLADVPPDLNLLAQPTSYGQQTNGNFVPPHLAAQQQQQQYAQHGLPTHIEGQSQSQSQSQSQNQTGTSSNYFRNEQPVSSGSPAYFHAPTPPAGNQDTGYGPFGQLGVSVGQQQQHQQGLGGFAGQEYGHSEGQRGFYDGYQSPGSSFGRGVLGHDDIKVLPAQQGGPTPGAGAQGGQQGPQGPGPQGQQGYPPPMQYHYYPYPAQNQPPYYGAPYNSGYPYVKYPVFPGPPSSGPGGQAGKPTQQAGQSGQYGPGQGLYQQGYDDYQPQQSLQQHHSLLSQGGNVNEYGKPMYGGNQSFGALSGPQSRGGNSPETAYKPYGAGKDVGVSANAGAGSRGGQAQQQQQGQGQASQSQQQAQPGAFYGGGRFGSGNSAGVGSNGPQGTAHHNSTHHNSHNSAHHNPQGHLGYSQGQNEFYSYQQGRQYWQ